MSAPPPSAPSAEDGELRERWRAAQARMAGAGLDALLLTGPADIAYFSGFLTRFWESPTRPWFLLLPASGAPVAVIPQIGAALMAQGPVQDIRTWPAPDFGEDGVPLLAEAIEGLAPGGGRIGLPSGQGTHLRMPLARWAALQDRLPRHRFTDDAGLVAATRMVKSEAEIARIRTACDIAARAFARVPQIARPGVPLSQVFRDFQALCLAEGADWVAYLAGGAGPGGYADVISPATDRPLARGDVLMLDTGLVHAGYFCDFDRNFALGPPARELAQDHARLIEATRAGFAAARPGARARDVFHAMDAVLTGGAGGGDIGRYGHGLGLELTEPPSLHPNDPSILEAGMVLTLEPSLARGGKVLVHEENIVLRADGAEWLSPPAEDLAVI